MCSLKNRPDNILKAGRRIVCVKAKAVFGRPAHVEGLNTRRTNNVTSFTSQAARRSEKTRIVSSRAFSVRLKKVFWKLFQSQQYYVQRPADLFPNIHLNVSHTFICNWFCFRTQWTSSGNPTKSFLKSNTDYMRPHIS